jgi:hypothetical protein
MKKHNFNEAIEIFKGMFEGWSVVINERNKYPITGFDSDTNTPYIFIQEACLGESQISHIEQTLPMNGDEVWARFHDEKERCKCIYIGKDKTGLHVCQTNDMSLWIFEHVELISPVRKLTIEQATEMLKGVVNEPFEIVK